MVPRKLGDMKIAEHSGSLNLALMNANTISVWYSSIRSLNYDEETDAIPVNDGNRKSQVENLSGPEPMQIDPPIQPLHKKQNHYEEVKESKQDSAFPGQDYQEQLNNVLNNQTNQTTGSNDLSRATMIQQPKDAPIDLNLKDFIEPAKNNEKRDMDIIHEVMEYHQSVI